MTNLPISIKLIIGFFAVFLMGIAFGLYSLVETQASLRSLLGGSSTFLAKERIRQVDKDIFLKIEYIQLYSKDTLLQKILADSNQNFDTFDSSEGLDIYDFMQQRDLEWTLEEKDMITPFMENLIYNEAADALRAEFIEFWEKKYGYRAYGEAFVTNKYGANVVQSGKTSDYYQADEEWWQTAKDKGFFVGNIEYDESAKTWTMPLGVRIEDSEGNFIGVIKAIPLIREVIRGVELLSDRYKATEIQLLTLNGKLIFSTKTFQMLEDVSETHVFQQLLREESGFFIASESGKEKLFAFARAKGFRDFEGLDWVVLVKYDTSEVFASIYKLRNTLILISISIFILMGVFIVILSRSILGPIRKLQKASDAIAGGNLDVKIDIKSKDEIGHLARSFTRMAIELKKSYLYLENKVKLRTEELERHVYELDKTSKMLTRRDLELSKTHGELEDRLKELDVIAKRLVRKDFELLQANETLQEVDKAKSNFVSIAAHQLRTPISAVKWSISMAISGDFGKVSRGLKEVLEKSSSTLDRLVRLISDLLNVARIEEGRFIFKFSPCQIEDILKSVFNGSVKYAKKEDISLKISLPPKLLPRVYADYDNLILVIQNIVDNALSYTLPNGSVEIIADIDPNDKKAVRVSVKDTGIGIPELQQKLIGQKFFRGDNIIRRQIQGTGLGLYIVSRILEKHGTKLQFVSKESKGSTFFFTLPFFKG